MNTNEIYLIFFKEHQNNYNAKTNLTIFLSVGYIDP